MRVRATKQEKKIREIPTMRQLDAVQGDVRFVEAVIDVFWDLGDMGEVDVGKFLPLIYEAQNRITNINKFLNVTHIENKSAA